MVLPANNVWFPDGVCVFAAFWVLLTCELTTAEHQKAWTTPGCRGWKLQLFCWKAYMSEEIEIIPVTAFSKVIYSQLYQNQCLRSFESPNHSRTQSIIPPHNIEIIQTYVWRCLKITKIWPNLPHFHLCWTKFESDTSHWGSLPEAENPHHAILSAGKSGTQWRFLDEKIM